jgi:hypothetical protein
MKRAIFVSDKSFDNYDLLSRAAAVIIQDFKDSDTEIEFVSLGIANQLCRQYKALFKTKGCPDNDLNRSLPTVASRPGTA